MSAGFGYSLFEEVAGFGHCLMRWEGNVTYCFWMAEHGPQGWGIV